MRRQFTAMLLVASAPWHPLLGQDTLGMVDFTNLVLQHHPLAVVADLQVDQAEAVVRAARGAFDPKLSASWSDKDFDDKAYYDRLQAGLKVPTWFGVDFEAGYANNDGLYLNPADNTPGDGLLVTGVSLPLGKGLFIDDRRAALRQAQASVGMSEAERRKQLNDLLFQSMSAYCDWQLAVENLRVYEEALTLAEQRLDAVKQSAVLGDRPFVDTLEARLQVQTRMLWTNEASLAVANARAQVSVFLWSDAQVPLEISAQTVPEAMALSERNFLPASLDSALWQHPALVKLQFGMEVLDVQERLALEKLKPALNVKYNALTQPAGPFEYDWNDHVWGVEFSVPLLLRQERAYVQQVRLKQEATEYQLQSTEAYLRMNVQRSLNDWQTAGNQVRIYESAVRNYEDLLRAERNLFSAGESSLFMVNARESAYIQARVNEAQSRYKWLLAAWKVRYQLAFWE